MKKICLDGTFELYRYHGAPAPVLPEHVAGKAIPAVVPGNVELDLMREGELPDLYFGQNVTRAQELEHDEFWYLKKFSFDGEHGERAYLSFQGVDAIAEYFLNGKKIGASENALIGHRFYAGDAIRAGENTLAVHITSSSAYEACYEIDPYNVAFPGCYGSLNARKPAHAYGWDILPRAISAGIWRSVFLEVEDRTEIRSLYLATARVTKDVAVLVVSCNAAVEESALGKCTLRVEGVCGEHTFSQEYPFPERQATVYPYVYGAKLWYPRGSGEQNLYDVTVSILCNGKTLASRKQRFGIRKAEVRFSDEFGEKGDFAVYVNGEKVRCHGANWTPLDIFHSRDREKYVRAVENLADANCNIVRVWGGGVYESDEFFSLCDEKGILVWQDIMLSCHAYPQTEEFLRKIREECRYVAREYSSHPSLILWCGSNETDWAYMCVGLDPNSDAVTRGAIAKELSLCDPYRNYLPSTPYYSPAFVKKHGGAFYLDLDEIEAERTELPEEHYWWHRNDFLTFEKQNHKFISEVGYGGSADLETLNECLKEGWTFADDEAWREHSFPTENTRSTGYDYLFTDVPENNVDRVLASQYYQAEAYKFISETSRIRPWCNGIILWNMHDGYPIFSSSLVDFKGRRKPAFHAVAASFEPLQCMAELKDGKAIFYVVNDSGKQGEADVVIRGDDGTQKKLCVKLEKNGVSEIARIPLGKTKFFTTALTHQGKTVTNYKYVYTDRINYTEYKKAHPAFCKPTD